MYQNGPPPMGQQGYYPPQQGQFMGQQVRTFDIPAIGCRGTNLLTLVSYFSFPSSCPGRRIHRLLPAVLYALTVLYASMHVHARLRESLHDRKQPMYYGQPGMQPGMHPNVIVQQQRPKDSGPGCCTCCLACCAGMLW